MIEKICRIPNQKNEETDYKSSRRAKPNLSPASKYSMHPKFIYHLNNTNNNQAKKMPERSLTKLSSLKQLNDAESSQIDESELSSLYKYNANINGQTVESIFKKNKEFLKEFYVVEHSTIGKEELEMLFKIDSTTLNSFGKSYNKVTLDEIARLKNDIWERKI